MLKIQIFLIGLLVISLNLFSENLKTGLIYGYGHAFFFSSSDNLVLDNEAGVNQGLHMVFYLKDSSWEKSSTIAYARNYPKSDKIKKPNDISQITVDDFVNNGSKNYHISYKTNLIIDGGKIVEVFHFTGDKWGNHEAVGYIEEENDINFLVYNSKNKKDFDKYYDDFIDILKSYQNVYPVFKFISQEEFNKKQLESKKILQNKYYKKYESKILKSMGQKTANQLQYCLRENNYNTDNFEIIFKIDKSGYIGAIYISENKNLCECFAWPFIVYKFPEHSKNDYFFFHLNIKLTSNKK